MVWAMPISNNPLPPSSYVYTNPLTQGWHVMTMDTNVTFQLPLFLFLLRKGVECQWVNKLVKRCINLFHSKWEIDEVISIY